MSYIGQMALHKQGSKTNRRKVAGFQAIYVGPISKRLAAKLRKRGIRVAPFTNRRMD